MEAILSTTGPSFDHCKKVPYEEQDSQCSGQFGNAIAKTGIEAEVRSGGNGGFDDTGGIPGEGFPDAAMGVDDTGDAGVGAAHDPTSGFDGAEAGIVAVLAVAGGIAPPAVVRDDGDKVGAIPAEVSQKFAVDAFITDSGCYFVSGVCSG